MNEQTPSRIMLVTNPDFRPTTNTSAYPADTARTHPTTSRFISELSALPRSPGEPLTPPDSNSFKKRIFQAYNNHHHPTSPLNTDFTPQVGKAQLIAEQKWEISLVNSQRAIDRQSIKRLEADRESREDYQQQRDGHRLWVHQQWVNGIEMIARLERNFEELQESEKLRFDQLLREHRVQEDDLREENEELRRKAGRMKTVVQEHAAGMDQVPEEVADAQASLQQLRIEREAMSELLVESSRRVRENVVDIHVTVEMARAALVERDNADGRNGELAMMISKLNGEARTFWASAASLLAALAMVVVLVESY